MERSRTKEETTTIDDILSKLYSVKSLMEGLKQNNVQIPRTEKVQIHMLLNILNAMDQYTK